MCLCSHILTALLVIKDNTSVGLGACYLRYALSPEVGLNCIHSVFTYTGLSKWKLVVIEAYIASMTYIASNLSICVHSFTVRK